MKSLYFSQAVLDLDGTLLTKQKTISLQNQQALHEYRSAGGTIILASGRNPVSVAWHARLLDLYGWHIAYDGNALVHVKDEFSEAEITYIKILDPEIISIFNQAHQLTDSQCLAFNEQHGYAQPGNQIKLPFIEHRFPLLEGQPSRQPEDWSGGFAIHTDPEWLTKIANLPLHRAAIFSEDNITHFYRILSQYHFEKNISSDGRSIEISPIGISKGNTLLHLSDIANFSLDDTLAIGDGQNDLSLLSAVRLGVAMGNAPENIKKVAYDVTDSNNDHGVALALNKWAYK